MLVYLHVATLGCFTGAKVSTISFQDQYLMEHSGQLAWMGSIKKMYRNTDVKWPVC